MLGGSSSPLLSPRNFLSTSSLLFVKKLPVSAHSFPIWFLFQHPFSHSRIVVFFYYLALGHLIARGRFSEAGRLWVDYGNDIEEAASVLARGREFSEAIRIVRNLLVLSLIIWFLTILLFFSIFFLRSL